MGDLQQPKAVVSENLQLPSQSSSSSGSGPDPDEFRSEKWVQAERVTQEIIWRVQPTVLSEERRREVIDYVQRLLRNRLGYEVFAFGSVPLKTYLPDGDIDLTAFGETTVEEVLAGTVLGELEVEGHNPAAEFIVKDVQYIGAEVKLVKCLVQNIVVDISFNQIGGLCALCFLEQVDRRIGKSHLFKQSIILIKAWCYYESRILGAHHGLISTYALETLVLYIFHLFHSSLDGPLAVLYKFLDFYSKFDWENFCVSLNGPVLVSSLPEIVAERPDNGGGELLLSNDFLKECVEMFSVPSRGNEMSSRAFPPKFLNIVDPLKETNNLGRSVSKGNFFRIRSAFSFGARKLGQILSRPEENIAEDVKKFFANTLFRHGRGQRPDVQDPPVMPCPKEFAYETAQVEAYVEQESVCSNGMSDDNNVVSRGKQPEVIADVLHDSEKILVRTSDGQQRGLQKQDSSSMLSAAGGVNDNDGICAPGTRFSGDAKDLAASVMQGLRITGDMHESNGFSGDYTSLRNGKMGNGHLDGQLISNGYSRTNSPLNPHQSGEEDAAFSSWNLADEQPVGYLELKNGSSTTTPDACYLEDSESKCWPLLNRTIAQNYETLKPLPDLTGDYDNGLNGLHYGRWWFNHAPSIPLQQMHMIQRSSPWDTVQHSMQFRQNMYGFGSNGVIPATPFFPANPLVTPGTSVTYGIEESPKARGTGLYFPNPNYHSFRERSFPTKALKSPRNNGRAALSLDKNTSARSSHEASQGHSLIRPGNGKSRSLDLQDLGSPRGKSRKDPNGLTPPVESNLEFGSAESALPESSRQSNSDASVGQNSSNEPLASGRQAGKPQIFRTNDRLGSQPYRLKDEDFPPLSF